MTIPPKKPGRPPASPVGDTIIAEIRRITGWSRLDLATVMGAGLMTVAQWEKKQRKLSGASLTLAQKILQDEKDKQEGVMFSILIKNESGTVSKDNIQSPFKALDLWNEKRKLTPDGATSLSASYKNRIFMSHRFDYEPGDTGWIAEDSATIDDFTGAMAR